MSLGTHHAIGPLLADTLTQEKGRLRSFVARHGVPQSDVDDVIHDAYLRVFNFSPQGDVARILVEGWTGSATQRERLSADLLALLVHHLRFACIDYHRRIERTRQMKEKLRTLPPADSLNSLRELRALLVDTIGGSGVDIDGVVGGDLDALAAGLEALCDRAGLSDDERRYAIHRLENPGALDREFSAKVKPYQIARIKQRVLHKLVRFLATGETVPSKTKT